MPNKLASDVKCMTCGTTFRFIRYHSKSYMETFQPYRVLPKPQNSIRSKEVKQGSRTNCCQFQDIKNNNENSSNEINFDKKSIKIESNLDDCDFEFMFSNNEDPFVGSYKQNISVPVGSINDTDFNQSGYFV